MKYVVMGFVIIIISVGVGCLIPNNEFESYRVGLYVGVLCFLICDFINGFE